jgi:ABC-2 type transport system permease protein
VTALVLGIARRNIIELRRYAFNTFFEILGIYVLFLLLFYGVRGFGGAQVRDGDVLPALVIGYLVFGLVFMSYSSLASWVTQEATLGTVEQLAMSPYGLPAVLIAEYATSVIRQAVVVTCIAIAAQATTGQWLHLRPLTIAPLVGLLLLQQLGVALGLAGLALIFKRMVAVTGLVQFAFVALVGAPLSRYEWLRFFPVSLANDLIRRAAVADTSLLALPRGSLVLLVGLAVAYAAVGIFVFTRAEMAARTRGLLGVH